MVSVRGAVSARSASVTVAALLSDTPVFTPCATYPVTVKFSSRVHCSPWTAPVTVVGPTHETSNEYGELVTYSPPSAWSGDPQVTRVRVPGIVGSGAPPLRAPLTVAVSAGGSLAARSGTFGSVRVSWV